jgi:DNA modification methylase
VGKIELYNENCLDTIKRLGKVDLILTDPPYPDYLADEYKYFEGIIDFMKDIDCKQLIFWSAKVDFPLDYTSIHIWDKKCGVGSMYERIFERNGGNAYKCYNYYLINSTVAASFAKDTFEGHPSQKPIDLYRWILQKYAKEGDKILDTHGGSMTIAHACDKEGFDLDICELDKEYFDAGIKRYEQFKAQITLF